jgi:hypothetical protein
MDPLFAVHLLNEDGKKKATELAQTFDKCLEAVTTVIGSGPSRETALVRTHLELASFYSKKAMAIRPENQA